jgi:hypothetical protein
MKITEEMIRIKAYELWEVKGRPTGAAEENWLAAQALLQDTAKTTPPRNQSLPNGLRQLNPSQA